MRRAISATRQPKSKPPATSIIFAAKRFNLIAAILFDEILLKGVRRLGRDAKTVILALDFKLNKASKSLDVFDKDA